VGFWSSIEFDVTKEGQHVKTLQRDLMASASAIQPARWLAVLVQLHIHLQHDMTAPH
jgi:hypothetical protein